jgi:hypothetical protein
MLHMPEVSQLVRATLESQPEFTSARGLKKKLCDVLYREFRDQKKPIEAVVNLNF